MIVSTEIISGKPVTVIRRPFQPDKVRESLERGVPVVAERISGQRYTLLKWLAASEEFVSYREDGWRKPKPHILEYTLTILPPLPRRPTADDAGLLYEYASKGVFANHQSWWCIDTDECVWVSAEKPEHMYGLYGRCWDFVKGGYPENAEITHCVNAQGERVEVAFVGGDDEQAG